MDFPYSADARIGIVLSVGRPKYEPSRGAHKRGTKGKKKARQKSLQSVLNLIKK